MKKKYLDTNVYNAANSRIDYVFKNFERIYISFSGGKDSGVMLNLIADYMHNNSISKKIGVLFVDLEGQYKSTIDYIKNTLNNNLDIFEPYWVCLPLNLRNAVSVFEPFWTPWNLKQRDKWVRDYPDFQPCITEESNIFPFFKDKMEFEEFVPAFGKWYSQGKPTACFIGIRSDESLNRFRTIASKEKATYQGVAWTTEVAENLYNIYPIYDWTTEDIWTANGRMAWDYNALYDMFYKAGIPISAQRICQPYGDDQRVGLNLFRVVEPETWHKVVNRVSGANFGNIYAGNKIMGYGKVKLPKGHTWKSYTKLLLSTLPIALQKHYKQKFIKFMRYWNKNGCPVRSEDIPRLPSQAKMLDKISTRGKKDKKLVVWTSIPDCLGDDFEAKKLAPTWRRMAICILKNDHLCKTLSFTQTKDQQNKISEMLEKYRSL